jgi:uncharacterized membrane protein
MSEAQNPAAAKPWEFAASPSRLRFFIIAGLTLLTIGGALRFYHLGNRSLWFDEAVTANASRGTLKQALDTTRLRGSAPVVHPYILYLVEKVGKTSAAVRAPSAVASLFAVFMMLAMIRAKVKPAAALFSAAILAVSASQIRYAQEIREYSLSVLFATILIYCLLRWDAAGSRSRHPVLLYAALFAAPLIQYGLVFLAFAVLCTICVRLMSASNTTFKFSHVVIASASATAGGLLSFALTLRYQFHAGQGQEYLKLSYFDPKTMSFLHFFSTNSENLFSFFIPGQIVTLCFLICVIFYCIARFRDRRIDAIAVVVFASVLVTVFASLFRFYPYGGIRQCLFLAPGLCLFAGVVFADMLEWMSGSWRHLATVGFLAVILFSGYRGMLRAWPYAEIEDNLSLLRELEQSSTPNDQVWVNHDAVDAFDFYLPTRDPRFIYGKYHKDSAAYMPEVLSSIDPHTSRIWLVFSHLEQPSDHAEEQLIVNTLRKGWDVQSVIAPTNAELFIAYRNVSP